MNKSIVTYGRVRWAPSSCLDTTSHWWWSVFFADGYRGLLTILCKLFTAILALRHILPCIWSLINTDCLNSWWVRLAVWILNLVVRLLKMFVLLKTHLMDWQLIHIREKLCFGSLGIIWDVKSSKKADKQIALSAFLNIERAFVYFTIKPHFYH